ncbi:MAG TPA: protein kinase [Pyrinomonadaceae bacterium]
MEFDDGAAVLSAMPLAPDTRLGRYDIRAQLGAGGMGEVYLALDTQLGRTVALKVLPADVAHDQDRMQRFRQEARAASTLNHPNVAHIYEIGEAAGVNFIAMEFVEGVTLRRRMVQTGMAMDEVLDVVLQVASALSAAHATGIVHRDIKPENVMLRPDGYIKVLDFGLAKLTEGGANNAAAPTLVQTAPGTVMGTVQYMSPEQARGLDVDVRSDIFSLGVVLYEMVAGRPPFEGETTTDVIAAILHHEPPPLERFSKDAPEALAWLVARALRKDREARYQTAKEFLADLRSLKQRLEFAAAQERSLAPEAGRAGAGGATVGKAAAVETAGVAEVPTTAVAAAHPTTSAEYLVREIKRHKGRIGFALAGLILVAAGVLLALNYAGRSKTKTAEPFGKVKVSRLTTNGRASAAAISPDGKYVVHVTGVPGHQSLLLRHIATGSDKEIVSSNGSDFAWVTFSPDGGYVLFSRIESGSGVSPVYQVPVLGGNPKRLTSEDADTPVTFSPDGKRYAFMRGTPSRGEVYLIVANADGTGEQTLVTRKTSDFVGATWSLPSWSPDGQIIAFAHLTPEGNGRNVNVIAVGVKDGTEKQLTFQQWVVVDALAWLPDGRGLTITAVDREAGATRQIRYVSYPGGDVRRITSDTNDYRGLSLTADATALVTVQAEQVSNVWAAPNGEAGRATQLTSNRTDGLSGVASMPDGRIVYTSNTGGRPDIWIMNADGSGQTQLTSEARNMAPAVSPDGRYIAYASTRAGELNIWRMDVDGGNPKRLTSNSLDASPSFSPDGQWVFYTTTESGKQKLRKVPAGGGDPVKLTDYTTALPLISPDGKLIACGYVNEQETPSRWRIAIISSDGGPPLKTFDISPLQARFQWAADGRAILYSATRAGVTNIWSQPVAGGAPEQLTDFKSDQIFRFDRSRDGKQLLFARGTTTSDVVLVSDVK